MPSLFLHWVFFKMSATFLEEKNVCYFFGGKCSEDLLVFCELSYDLHFLFH